MWKTVDDLYLCYYINDYLVIKILKKRHIYGKDLLWFSAIYSPNQSMRVIDRIYSKSIEILKLKSLISAKDFGWDIEKINI